MSKSIRIIVSVFLPRVLLVSALSMLWVACYDDPTPPEPEPELPTSFDEALFHPNFSWDMERVLNLDVQLSEELQQDAVTVEVRHTVDRGALLYRGTLSSQNDWHLELRVRLPQHESEVAVAIGTATGIRRHIVPLLEDGFAEVFFE